MKPGHHTQHPIDDAAAHLLLLPAHGQPLRGDHADLRRMRSGGKKTMATTQDIRIDADGVEKRAAEDTPLIGGWGHLRWHQKREKGAAVVVWRNSMGGAR